MRDDIKHARPAPTPVIHRASLRPDASVEQLFVEWHASTRRDRDDDAERVDRLTSLVHADPARLVPECIEALRANPLACLRAAEVLVADSERTVKFFKEIPVDDTAALLREIDAQDPMLAARLLQIITEHTPSQAMGLYHTVTQALRGGFSNYHSWNIESGYNSIDDINLSQPERPLTYKFLL